MSEVRGPDQSEQEIPNSRFFLLEYQGIKRYFHYQMPPSTLEIGHSICLNKAATKEFLKQAGISVPPGYFIPQQITDQKYWLEVYEALQKPLVVKPSHGKKGEAVFTSIDTKEEYISAITEIFKFERDDEEGVVVEEMVKGSEFRILASRDQVLGITNRVPANVVGDGNHTLQELIDLKNADPRRSDFEYDPYVKIKIDEHVQAFLTRKNIHLSDVPAAGEQVFVRQNSNISTGGDSYDKTDVAHPTVKEIALKTVQAIPGAELVGIDFMTEDITQPQNPDSYHIIEVNGSPALYMHMYPYVGKPRQSALELLYLIFPEIKSDRA